MKRKRSIIALCAMILMVSIISLQGNTTRDIGEEPVLDMRKVRKWVLFYTNMERVKYNHEPLVYNEILEKAADWQADYCKNLGDLSHYGGATYPDPVDRVMKFNGTNHFVSENLIVEFSANIANKRFYYESDDQGDYYDYGDEIIYWFNEKQLAWEMVDGWMHSTGHRKNILRDKSTAIGVGILKGVYSSNSAYYGCQVFSCEDELDISTLSVTKNEDGTYLVHYEGNFKCLAVSVNKDIIEIIKSEKVSEGFTVKKNETGLSFIALYDKTSDILYPVRQL